MPARDGGREVESGWWARGGTVWRTRAAGGQGGLVPRVEDFRQSEEPPSRPCCRLRGGKVRVGRLRSPVFPVGLQVDGVDSLTAADSRAVAANNIIESRRVVKNHVVKAPEVPDRACPSRQGRSTFGESGAVHLHRGRGWVVHVRGRIVVNGHRIPPPGSRVGVSLRATTPLGPNAPPGRPCRSRICEARTHREDARWVGDRENSLKVHRGRLVGNIVIQPAANATVEGGREAEGGSQHTGRDGEGKGLQGTTGGEAGGQGHEPGISATPHTLHITSAIPVTGSAYHTPRTSATTLAAPWAPSGATAAATPSRPPRLSRRRRLQRQLDWRLSFGRGGQVDDPGGWSLDGRLGCRRL